MEEPRRPRTPLRLVERLAARLLAEAQRLGARPALPDRAVRDLCRRARRGLSLILRDLPPGPEPRSSPDPSPPLPDREDASLDSEPGAATPPRLCAEPASDRLSPLEKKSKVSSRNSTRPEDVDENDTSDNAPRNAIDDSKSEKPPELPSTIFDKDDDVDSDRPDSIDGSERLPKSIPPIDEPPPEPEEKKTYIKCANIASLLKPELLKVMDVEQKDEPANKPAGRASIRLSVIDRAPPRECKKSSERTRAKNYDRRDSIKRNILSGRTTAILKLRPYPSSGEGLKKILAANSIARLYDEFGKLFIETEIKSKKSKASADRRGRNDSTEKTKKKLGGDAAITISSESDSEPKNKKSARQTVKRNDLLKKFKNFSNLRAKARLKKSKACESSSDGDSPESVDDSAKKTNVIDSSDDDSNSAAKNDSSAENADDGDSTNLDRAKAANEKLKKNLLDSSDSDCGSAKKKNSSSKDVAADPPDGKIDEDPSDDSTKRNPMIIMNEKLKRNLIASSDSDSNFAERQFTTEDAEGNDSAGGTVEDGIESYPAKNVNKKSKTSESGTESGDRKKSVKNKICQRERLSECEDGDGKSVEKDIPQKKISDLRRRSSSSLSSNLEIRLKPRKKRILSTDNEESDDSTRKMGRSTRRDNKKSKDGSIMKENKKSKKEDNLLDTLSNGKSNTLDGDKDNDESSVEMMTDNLKHVIGNSTSELVSELLEDSSDNSESLSKTNGMDKNNKGSKKKSSINSDDSSNDKMVAKSDDSEIESAKNKSKQKPSSDDIADNEALLTASDSAESEIFKPTKKKRKKKKSSDESGSERSSSENKSQKKRRRIKNVSGDDSEGSGNGNNSDSDEGDNKKHGRKNIRKVKRSSNLDDATRKAARIERERVQRIAERQKLFNESMFDEFGRPDEAVKLDKIVLDYDPKTKEPIISVDKGLVEKLKPHQGNGIKFMWDACFESVKQINDNKGSGCILAHCMGLGKTLQVVTLVHTLLTHQELTKVERVLVVCPLSTVLNWVNEFKMWLKYAECKDLEIYELSKYKQNYERSNKLKEWLECGGVCVLGYDMFRNLSSDSNKKFRKAQLNAFQKSLVDPGPDLVVCDEGHLLKNEKTSLSQSMNRIKTLRRIVLTGTPLQNNLKEYYCMVQFVKPNLLGKYNEYLNRFVNPITNGQYTDSTEHDIRIMKRRSHVLHKMLDGAVQRRDYAVLAPFLPPKHEYVLFISLTEIQIKLYSHYMENFSRRPQPDRKNTGFLFPDFQSLQRIWTHPLVLKANSERYEIMQQKKRDKEEEDSEGSLADFIDDDETTTPDETSSSDDQSDDCSDDSTRRDKKKKSKPKGKPAKRVTRATIVDDEEEVIETKPELPDTRQDNPTEWWMSLCSEEELNDIRHSNKLILLLDILKMCDAIGDKLLVFSQSLYSLDLIEQFLWKIDEATQKGENEDNLGGHLGSWSPGIDYFRLDGSTSCENRAIWCKNFNKEDNPRARLFLISTRAGGLGINLVAANRVVIFDMSWNPSHDVQSIFRVYRFGQKKPCYVYRFLALGTMEEKIYERQVTKQAISKRVIDEQQIDRHYAESDLAELYTFCPVPEGQREVPKLPKDRLFADLIKQHDTMIYKYHEHDSLLENKEEETLTEEERKAAWEDYENEKTRPPTLGGQLLAGYHQQQQHNLAMSALLQQDYPGLTEQQIAGMVPALLQKMYQSGDTMLPQQMFNQGYDYNLMQKMNAMMTAQNSLMGGYKYPQAQLMNPNLMLNPVSAAAGAASFNQSNWQQQQQIQLQRLQQQQAMQANLKYYAGGLGSRDTIDMAAMQQRQRAMMMAANSNIPQRGRPPKSQSLINMGAMPILPMKNPPATMSNEIVDLDSE